METVLRNARVILADEVAHASVRIVGGQIVAIDPHGPGSGGSDCEGDFLAPGIVDLHTDNLEKHFFPRPNIDWNPVSAAMTHDGGCISVGVTTVFDSLSLGSFGSQESRSSDNLYRLCEGLGEAAKVGALKAEHRLHWRCELPSDQVIEEAERLGPHPLTGLFSLMDHTPGQRQYMNKERFLDRAWRANGMSEEAIVQRMATQLERQARNVAPNRARIAALAQALGAPLAAHDDETAQHVDDAADVGATIAEFPVTAAAAKRSRERGMAVIMGGPNLIRGGSYSGNMGAAEAADLSVLDGFASDYVPRSLIECAFALTAPRFGWSLPAAFATVSRVPAVATGLDDRGVIAPDKRADLVRIRMVGGLPMVRGVWVGGARVG